MKNKVTENFLVECMTDVLLYDKNDNEFSGLYAAATTVLDPGFSLDLSKIKEDLSLTADEYLGWVVNYGCPEILVDWKYWLGYDKAEKRIAWYEPIRILLKHAFVNHKRIEVCKDTDKNDQYQIDLSCIGQKNNINDFYFLENITEQEILVYLEKALDGLKADTDRSEKATLTKKNIILVEKDKDYGTKTGLLKLDKTMYEKIVNSSDMMSPKQFMKSLVSLAESIDNLWNSRYMKTYSIYV